MMPIFLSGGVIMCLGCSKGQPHRDGSLEYPPHVLTLPGGRLHLRHLVSDRSDLSVRITKLLVNLNLIRFRV